MRLRLLQVVPPLEAAVRDQPHKRNRNVEGNGEPWRDEGRRNAESVDRETDPLLLPRADHGPNSRLRAFRQDQLAFEPDVAESRHHGHGSVGGDGLRRDSGKADPADHEGHQGQPEQQEQIRPSARPFTRGATDYADYRRRKKAELDREYADYSREKQARFDRDFDAWREKRGGPPRSADEPARQEMTASQHDAERS